MSATFNDYQELFGAIDYDKIVMAARCPNCACVCHSCTNICSNAFDQEEIEW